MPNSIVRNDGGTDAGTKPLSHALPPHLAHQRICVETCQTSRACCSSLGYICPGSTLATDAVGRHQLVLHRRQTVPVHSPFIAQSLTLVLYQQLYQFLRLRKYSTVQLYSCTVMTAAAANPAIAVLYYSNKPKPTITYVLNSSWQDL